MSGRKHWIFRHKLSFLTAAIVVGIYMPSAQTKGLMAAPAVAAKRTVTLQLAPPTPVQRGAQAQMPSGLAQSVKALWAGFNGTVGIAITPETGGWMIEHRGGELMPQQSVSKLWVALTVFDAIDAGRVRLSDTVRITDTDRTVFHQPIARLIDADGYEATISELLTRAMTQSDNLANDVLLRRVGGPDAVRRVISNKGLGAIRFGPGERLLQSGTAGLKWKDEYRLARTFQNARAALAPDIRKAAFDAYVADPVDGAAPASIARALVRLKRGDLLSGESTRALINLMAASETGKARVRGGLPVGWSFAHKTGTGQDLKGTTAGYNDVGILTAPDGASYAVAIMISRTSLGVPARQQLMQALGAVIVANHALPGGLSAGSSRNRASSR